MNDVVVPVLAPVLENLLSKRKERFDSLLKENNISLEKLAQLAKHEQFETHLLKAVSFSDFICETIQTRFDDFLTLLESGDLYQARSDDAYQNILQALCESCDNDTQWMRVLRRFRQMEMLRFIWREVNVLTDLRQSAKEISNFASAAIDVSLSLLSSLQKKTMGTPRSREDGSEQSLCVIGMGKLGGKELNLSSDIDLVFFYRDVGETDAQRPVENQKYFVRLAQQLIRVLDEKTADGFVFRVDMRLRPYGDSGLLVLNQNAMELYYETQGRTWERYAFIKAAWVAGHKETTEEFLHVLKPFIYRKYVDFSVVESLREMKLLINRQVKSKGLEHDIKLGEGGIRELEFIVQALQLIKGGRKTSLQLHSYYEAMDEVLKLGLMSAEDHQQLCACYTFFRRIEHLIQGRSDKQSQLLPLPGEEGELFAWALDFSCYEDFINEVTRCRFYVRNVFNELFAEAGEGADEKNIPVDALMSDWVSVNEQDIEFSCAEETALRLNEILKGFSSEKLVKNLSENEKHRLDVCMAYLIFRIAEYENPIVLMERVLQFLRVVLHRSVYLVLLNENPTVFDYLLSLFQRSEWMLDNLIQHPFLLDELLQVQHHRELPSADSLWNELHQLSLRMDGHDFETALEELRVFKCTHELRAAALYLDKHLNTSDLGDFLSVLAQALLQEACRIALNQCVEQESFALREYIQQQFAVVAYGKLGSREMGFGSDLDLVFIFDDANPPVEDIGRVLTRYGQKIIHLLSVRTYSGILFEVDMRLRPSGSSGTMVSSLNGFRKYQNESAWTWEHQALMKARVVAGSEHMIQAFNTIRADVLAKERQVPKLLQEMLDMQKRLQDNSPAAQDLVNFHLKSDQGGIVDIEFLAQFLMLSQAHHHPELLKAHATLEVFAYAELNPELKPAWLPRIREIYLKFRRQINELKLAYQKAMLPREGFQQERDEVAAVWKSLRDTYLE